MKKDNQKNYETGILSYLKKIGKGSNIANVARALNINKITAAKYLKLLKHKGSVYTEDVANTKKLWHYKG